MVCLYPINICHDILVSFEFFCFFWNVFKSKAVKIGYNIRCASILLLKYKATLTVPIDLYSSDLSDMLHPLFQVIYFLNKHH